ncbi:(5-formylfuran-3-yl)methyl phosphate synthase [Methyloradius palustris]|uniref:(5-formylfuran-3-yl)methyl phosphate synthase n=1 Tax=Methyloradius palustris TaxID=2778876 RepID=UPI001C8C3319|nr:(5-formylfuran-3-yl)methyl phosphate synthase [Methyloradius palustris]
MSVKDAQEALLAIDYGDIIDLKNPVEGALGALTIGDIEDIVAKLDGQKISSATIGDLPMQPELLLAKIRETANTGVDIVKIGLFPSPKQIACIEAIGQSLASEIKIVAVVFAENALDISLLGVLKASNFYGVMLDTAIKNGKNLTDHVALAELVDFVQAAKTLGLFVGLAGSLRFEHIETLKNIGADYLGFRGGLCEQDDRKCTLSEQKLKTINILLHKNNTVLQMREVSIR